MATKVYFAGIWENDGTRIFRTSDGDSLWITSFKDGIAVADPIGGHIKDFSELIAGCFDEDSNFIAELLSAFDYEENTPFTGIKFDFNEVTILVTKENADKDKIYAEWQAGWNANVEKHRLEREAYMKTPEYRAKRAKELKTQTRGQRVEKDVFRVDESSELEFKDDEAKAKWEEFVKVNSKDPYSKAVVTYARLWAKYMQHLMRKHKKTVPEIASKASFAANADGITGFMYGCAVNILSQCWKYGEELRRWHNKEWGYEEDTKGVVNPAVLTINVD